jgi:hypothetical protein
MGGPAGSWGSREEMVRNQTGQLARQSVSGDRSRTSGTEIWGKTSKSVIYRLCGNIRSNLLRLD